MHQIARYMMFRVGGTLFDSKAVKADRIKPSWFYLFIERCQCILKTNYLFKFQT